MRSPDLSERRPRLPLYPPPHRAPLTGLQSGFQWYLLTLLIWGCDKLRR